MSLDKEDSYGRLDVLAYKASERLVQELEAYWGCPGVWDSIKGHVEEGIRDLKMRRVPEPLVDVVRELVETSRRVRNDKRGQ